jgi:hypothetical protein
LIPTNDLNDWNGAQRWNVWNPLPHQVSGAVERLEPTRLMGWRTASFILRDGFSASKSYF